MNQNNLNINQNETIKEDNISNHIALLFAVAVMFYAALKSR